MTVEIDMKLQFSKIAAILKGNIDNDVISRLVKEIDPIFVDALPSVPEHLKENELFPGILKGIMKKVETRKKSELDKKLQIEECWLSKEFRSSCEEDENGIGQFKKRHKILIVGNNKEELEKPLEINDDDEFIMRDKDELNDEWAEYLSNTFKEDIDDILEINVCSLDDANEQKYREGEMFIRMNIPDYYHAQLSNCGVPF